MERVFKNLSTHFYWVLVGNNFVKQTGLSGKSGHWAGHNNITGRFLELLTDLKIKSQEFLASDMTEMKLSLPFIFNCRGLQHGT